MKKQVTAVIDEVTSVLGDRYDSNVPASTLLSPEELQTVQNNIFAGLKDGSIEYKKDTTDDKAIRTYAKSLVSNHLRKAKALNGNVQHKPSGTGPKRDDQLKELSNLLKTGQYTEGTEEHAAILEAISTRKEELAKTRATKGASSKAPVIDTSVLPAELQDLAIS